MEIVRVSVNLPEPVVEIARKLASESHTTVTEIIRRSIIAEDMLHNEVKQGNKILIEDPNKKVRQLILRS